jgi:arylsulfatase A-like enzyme
MAAMVARMDWSVGRILDKLNELGLSDRTAVVFTSDNGGLSNVYDDELKKNVLATSNRPYRGGKSQNYEGGIRIPLIIKWPGVTQPGSKCSVPVISTDLYPTFLSVAGLPLRPQQHLDGLSLAPLLKGGESLPRNCLYWHYPHYQTLPPHSAVRCGGWKLIRHYETGKIELYNLANDNAENTNLAAQYPEKAKQLKGFLDHHLQAIGAQMPTANPKYDPSSPSPRGNGPFDPYEQNEENDPRTYVTDPALDYGMNH